MPVVNEANELLGIVSVSDVAVIAQDLIDHILDDARHKALREVRLRTGGQRIAKAIRRPTKLDRLPPEPSPRPVRRRVTSGPTKTGRPRYESRAEAEGGRRQRGDRARASAATAAKRSPGRGRSQRRRGTRRGRGGGGRRRG